MKLGTRTTLFHLCFVVGSLLLAAFGTAQEIVVSSRAREIQNSAIVIDTHEDTPQRFLDEHYDIGSTDPKDTEFISLDKARAGNLGALFFSIGFTRNRIKDTSLNERFG